MDDLAAAVVSCTRSERSSCFVGVLKVWGCFSKRDNAARHTVSEISHAAWGMLLIFYLCEATTGFSTRFVEPSTGFSIDYNVIYGDV